MKKGRNDNKIDERFITRKTGQDEPSRKQQAEWEDNTRRNQEDKQREVNAERYAYYRRLQKSHQSLADSNGKKAEALIGMPGVEPKEAA